SDCEGAGQMFKVTTLDLEKPPRIPSPPTPLPQGERDQSTPRPSGERGRGEGSIDFAKDFFSRPAFLTVSGQLEAETLAGALGKVYTFGPTFRAENSNTPRHLAEFWMVEPEMAFYDLEDNMSLAEAFIKRIIKDALDRCEEDMKFFAERIDEDLLTRLDSILKSEFLRLSY